MMLIFLSRHFQFQEDKKCVFLSHMFFFLSFSFFFIGATYPNICRVYKILYFFSFGKNWWCTRVISLTPLTLMGQTWKQIRSSFLCQAQKIIIILNTCRSHFLINGSLKMISRTLFTLIVCVHRSERVNKTKYSFFSNDNNLPESKPNVIVDTMFFILGRQKKWYIRSYYSRRTLYPKAAAFTRLWIDTRAVYVRNAIYFLGSLGRSCSTPVLDDMIATGRMSLALFAFWRV